MKRGWHRTNALTNRWVGRLYQLILDKEEPSREEFELGSQEFKRWWKLRDKLHSSTDGILRVDVPVNQNYRPGSVAPQQLLTRLIWEAHRQAHTGRVLTVAWLRLHWYWPGMVAETQRLLATCEVCQMAKVGRIQETEGRRRLYAGQPRQMIAIGFVGPILTTPLGNR